MNTRDIVTEARARWEAIIGREWSGDWFTVEQERVDSFDHASYFEDDGEEDPYPEGLIEGFHLLALLDHFGGQVIPSTGPSGMIGWNYGLNKVRFVTPVHVGDRVRLHATVQSVAPKGEHAYLVTVAYVAELDGADRPGFTAEFIAFHTIGDAS